MKKQRISSKHFTERLSVASGSEDMLQESLSAEICSLSLEGFERWSRRRDHTRLLRRYSAAAIVSTVLCAASVTSASGKATMIANGDASLATMVSVADQLIKPTC